MTERVDDPTKAPPVLAGDGRRPGRTRTNGPFDERVRIVNGHEDAARPSSDRAGAENSWVDAREPLAAAMNAALAPFIPYWLGGFESAEDAAAADQERVAQLRLIFDAWAQDSEPEWWEERGDPLPPHVAAAATP